MSSSGPPILDPLLDLFAERSLTPKLGPLMIFTAGFKFLGSLDSAACSPFDSSNGIYC